jgi:hypothetical protein
MDSWDEALKNLSRGQYGPAPKDPIPSLPGPGPAVLEIHPGYISSAMDYDLIAKAVELVVSELNSAKSANEERGEYRFGPVLKEIVSWRLAAFCREITERTGIAVGFFEKNGILFLQFSR